MKKARKFLALALAVLMAVTLFASCNSSTGNGGSSPAPTTSSAPPAKPVKNMQTDNIRIAYIPVSTLGDLNIPAKAACDEMLAQFPNVKVDMLEAGFDTNKQISLVNDCVVQGYDAIILETIDYAALSNAVKAAEDAGIPVITQHNTTDTVHTSNIAGSDYASGAEAAQHIADLCNNTGNVIILDGPQETVIVRKMGQGAEDYIPAHTNMKVLSYQNIANWSQENANTAMRDLLTKYPSGQIQAVYATNDDMAIGAIQAINAAGRQGDGIVVWSYIGTPQGMQAIQDGTLAGTHFLDTYHVMIAELSVALFCIATGADYHTLNIDSTPMLQLSCPVITKDNVDTYLAINRYDK